MKKLIYPIAAAVVILGSAFRFALDTYSHISGASPEEVAENSLKSMAQGFRTVRVSVQNNSASATASPAPYKTAGYGYEKDVYKNLPKYLKEVPKMFEAIRKRCGDDVGIIHDIHEQTQPRYQKIKYRKGRKGEMKLPDITKPLRN